MLEVWLYKKGQPVKYTEFADDRCMLRRPQDGYDAIYVEPNANGGLDVLYTTTPDATPIDHELRPGFQEYLDLPIFAKEGRSGKVGRLVLVYVPAPREPVPSVASPHTPAPEAVRRGQQGGYARAAKLSPEMRSAQASQASRARWARVKATATAATPSDPTTANGRVPPMRDPSAATGWPRIVRVDLEGQSYFGELRQFKNSKTGGPGGWGYYIRARGYLPDGTAVAMNTLVHIRGSKTRAGATKA